MTTWVKVQNQKEMSQLKKDKLHALSTGGHLANVWVTIITYHLKKTCKDVAISIYEQ